VRFAGQARFHPRRYLAGLANAFLALGGRLHEHSEVSEFCETPRHVKVNGHTLSCDVVVIATHNPLVGFRNVAGAALFQTKLALYTSYAIAGRVPTATIPDALWWDTADPYHYLRIDRRRGHDVVIFGGGDHKTGQESDTTARFEHLEQRLRAVVPKIDVRYRWSGQVIETPDGLPYIGESAEHQYSATGFSGNGMTLGTVAGLMITDAVLQRQNPWRALFHPGRTALTRGAWDYVKENVDYPYYLIRDLFAGTDAKSVRAVKRGDGKIVELRGAHVAASRDATGRLTIRSAICTHLGCTVRWNATERTWDCPCHGSRFRPNGDVISGPAEAPLPEVK
jgi:Rieske Fe-S protein